MWTDEALDQLLDRNELSTSQQQAEGEEGAAAAAGSSDILAGFKVAHFELKEQQLLPEAAAQQGQAGGAADWVAEAGGAAAGISAGDFWQQLLAGHHAELQAAATASLGKGKRQRRKLVSQQDQEALLDSYLREVASSGDSDSGRHSRGRSSGDDDADYEVGPEEEQEQRADEEQDVADWGLVPEERQQWHQLQQQRKQARQEQEQQQRRQPGKPAKRPIGRPPRLLHGGLGLACIGMRTVPIHVEPQLFG